ncbi:transcriptional regulator, AsnC family [Ferrimonas balearica DSM 9799]|uniref:Transcriptional regulator, AsnC family n=1 Tax=Ferrimonas balearica (strain DSM 9799 / CCM 4581 / KCTC 23876 / PAT) TaxID=550540 RepID=E1SRB3_FERBD|nr:transcriptional regulator AsnC [Ferrimonas balearica]ADN74878.1 transcriptional regulator, AsnC family [Ferrimonas balearica DSM 9799]MBW3140678.1 transcriptional regulator AsnC [Ferrimonas balearica]MBW3165345.1 transcriptional regulator AsnC [Ferrimonas balearica]MBY5981445.1 transcriptional regulator AsnC [Ferrimonas balearica]MBY6107517.1 transcriptional regulator AsnC [Ferrimonas balearica]
MTENYRIDNLDKALLSALQQDARVPYAELAKRHGVSAGTVHVRVEKMKQAGIITGTQAMVDPKSLGYQVCCFIGINLKAAGDYPKVLAKLQALPEVVEAYYTTGHYSIFTKIQTRSIDALHHLLVNQIQAIPQIQSTETLLSLQQPIQRQVTP